MTERIRFRCPCCGMIANLDRIEQGQPYKIQVFSQKFGGKVAGDLKGRGKAKGLMKYTNITRSSVEIVREIEEMVGKTYQSIRNSKKSRQNAS